MAVEAQASGAPVPAGRDGLGARTPHLRLGYRVVAGACSSPWPLLLLLLFLLLLLCDDDEVGDDDGAAVDRRVLRKCCSSATR